MEDGENELTSLIRTLLQELYDELIALNQRIKGCDQMVHQVFNSSEACQRFAQIEGIGPISATAIVSDLGNPRHFKNGRHYAAYLGLVPRQHSSGENNYY